MRENGEAEMSAPPANSPVGKSSLIAPADVPMPRITCNGCFGQLPTVRPLPPVFAQRTPKNRPIGANKHGPYGT